MVNYTLELFTLTDLTEMVGELLKDNEHVTSIHFEDNPNKEHSSIMVGVSFTEEQDDDVEYIEEVFDNIENAFYSQVEVIDAYEQFTTVMSC